MSTTAESTLSAASLAEMHDRKELFISVYRDLRVASVPDGQAVEIAREFVASVGSTR